MAVVTNQAAPGAGGVGWVYDTSTTPWTRRARSAPAADSPSASSGTVYLMGLVGVRTIKSASETFDIGIKYGFELLE